MKLKSLFVLICIVFCGWMAYCTPATDAVTAAGVTAKTPALAGVYQFKGSLNGKIPVFMWFFVKDGVIKGEITYLNTPKRLPILLLGSVAKDRGPLIYEFTPTGEVTGIFEGQFDQHRFNGHWFGPRSNKEMECVLHHSDTVLKHKDANFQPATTTGQYQYVFGKTGSNGTVTLQVLKPGVCKIAISSVTAAPAYNMADVDAFTTPIANNILIYKVENGSCQFRIKTFKNFLVIDRLTDNLMDCGFGHNATIEGVYLKTSSKATFDKVKR